MLSIDADDVDIDIVCGVTVCLMFSSGGTAFPTPRWLYQMSMAVCHVPRSLGSLSLLEGTVRDANAPDMRKYHGARTAIFLRSRWRLPK